MVAYKKAQELLQLLLSHRNMHIPLFIKLLMPLKRTPDSFISIFICKLPHAEAASMNEIRLKSCGRIGHVLDMKPIRTDTTLDLSQKAEKGMILFCASTSILV